MELFLRQQFEVLLQEATGNFTERIVYRCGGRGNALELLRADPEGEGVFRGEFVRAFFEENLLNNEAGQCFVLEALAHRTLPADPGGPAGEVLARLAHAAFADLLTAQAAQLIQRQQIYS